MHVPLRATWLALLVAAGAAPQEGALRVKIDFPGGSAKVEAIDPVTRTVKISPSVHPDRGWTCWWYFKLEGTRPGETITLDVGPAPWATPDRAHFSADGRQWTHTKPGERQGNRIVYRQEVAAPEAWFAWGPPYVLSHALAAVEAAAGANPHAKAFTLATTREGRAVPALSVSEPGAERGVWVQARQHAWESGGSWVCHGFLEWLCSNDPRAGDLRRRAAVTVVPVMDADNAERGAGGKEQKPQDHNRDWSDAPHWPEVRAAQERIRAMDAGGRFDLFLDLHNPGAGDRDPFFFVPVVKSLSERGRLNLDAFLAAAREEIAGPLAFKGKTQESGPSYDKNWERISKNWVARSARDHVVAVTLETAWNTPAGIEENYRRVGRELGLAIERYLRGPVRR